jgi:hypothetical protein
VKISAGSSGRVSDWNAMPREEMRHAGIFSLSTVGVPIVDSAMPVAAARNKVWQPHLHRAAEYPARSARFRDAFFFAMTRTKAAIPFQE